MDILSIDVPIASHVYLMQFVCISFVLFNLLFMKSFWIQVYISNVNEKKLLVMAAERSYKTVFLGSIRT